MQIERKNNLLILGAIGLSIMLGKELGNELSKANTPSVMPFPNMEPLFYFKSKDKDLCFAALTTYGRIIALTNVPCEKVGL
jgi:hypothetical protein